MKTKKQFAAILAVVMLLIALAGCVGETDARATANTTDPVTAAATTDPEEIVVDAYKVGGNDQVYAELRSSSTNGLSGDTGRDAQIVPIEHDYDTDKILYQENGITIRPSEISYELDSDYGFTLFIDIENISGHPILFEAERAVMNGISVRCRGSVEVPALETGTAVLVIMPVDLTIANITRFETVSIFDATVTNTLDHSDVFKLGFSYTNPEFSGESHQVFSIDGVEMVGEDADAGLSIVYQGTLDTGYGRALVLYVRNYTEQIVDFQVYGVAVNDVTILSVRTDEPIYPGTACYCMIDLAEWDLMSADIDLDSIQRVTGNVGAFWQGQTKPFYKVSLNFNL